MRHIWMRGMRSRNLQEGALLALIAAFGGAAYAQTATKDAGAVQILMRSAAALGLQKATVSTIAVSGTYTRFAKDTSQSLAFRMLGALPDRIRFELDTPNGPAVTVVKGAGGFRRYNGRSTPLSVGQAAARALDYLTVLAVGHWISSPQIRIGQPESAAVGGKDYHQISIQLAALGQETTQWGRALEQASRAEIFVEARTDLPTWFRYHEFTRDWRLGFSVDLVLSDFQNMGGLVVPMNVTRYVEGMRIAELRIQSVKLNVPVSETDFQE